MNEQPGITESAMRSSGFLPRLAAGLLLLNLGVVALAGWSIRQNFLIHDEQAELATQNLAHALENDLRGTIRTHEMALHAVLDEFYRQRDAGRVDAVALDAYIERVRTRMPGVDAIRITDAQGILRYGSGVEPGEHTSLADRPHFIQLRDQPDTLLAFSKPQVSRVNNKWVQVLAHRIDKPDGSFGGMVFAAIPLAYLSQTFSVLDIGERGIVALRELEAVPVPDPTAAGGYASLAGEVPSILNPPSGCAFHPRCVHSRDICTTTRPKPRTFGNATVACHRVEELAGS
jgi:oligopeptide/dipeptide ABC transporter ATP-binding protein